MSTDTLARISAAKTALMLASTFEDVLEIRDKAAAIQVYVKAAGEGLDAQNRAAEIRLRAERKAGEMLRDMGIKDGRPKNGDSMSPLLSIGITKKQSSRWQLEAKLDEEEFESIVQECIASNSELTQSLVLSRAKEKKKRQHVSKVFDCESIATTSDLSNLAGRKFGTIYADPPWKYGNQGTRASTDNHYGTMTIDELCKMPIADLAADDAHLHLWTTNAFLFEAKKVMDAWGFEYRSVFVWVKPQMGIGNYWRVSHEFMLLGIRGNAKRFNERNHISWMEAERKKHSAKPERVRRIIEKVSNGPFLELFGRSPVDGWTVFGNQIEQGMLL